ncbi:MAG: TonB-dependent receptor [Helicobacteraceae bacterium]
MKKPLLALLAFCFSLASAQEALAQKATATSAKLQKLEVSTARIESASSPRSVSIVTQEDLAARNAQNLVALLSEEAGVSFAPDGANSGQLVLRGFSTQNFRAPLFINGDRFRGRNTLEYMLFDADAIERVEIIKGAASSLYGTDSFGGIVNIITKQAAGDASAASFKPSGLYKIQYQSSGNGFGNRLELGGAGAGVDLLLGLSHKRAGNYTSASGEIPNSNYTHKGLDLNFGVRALGGRIGVLAKHTEVNRGRAGGQFGAPGAGDERAGALRRVMKEMPMQEKYVNLNYKGKPLGGALLDLSVYRRELSTHIKVIPNLNNPSVFMDNYVEGPIVWGGHAISAQDLGTESRLELGLDWYNERREGSKLSKKGGAKIQQNPLTKQFNIGVFALASGEPINPLKLLGSLRYDYFKTSLDADFIQDAQMRTLFKSNESLVNKQLTGGFGASFRAAEFLEIVQNTNTSFRAPSTTELAAVGIGVSTDFTLPAKDLKPESGITHELGLRLSFGGLRSELTGFLSHYKDLIITKKTKHEGHDAKVLTNAQKASVRGLEYELRADFSNAFLLRANLAYIEGKNESTGKTLPQIMPLNGFASLKYLPSDAAFLELTGSFWADKTRFDESLERRQNGAALFNFYGGFKFARAGLNVTVGLENILNKAASSPVTPQSIKHAVSKTNPLLLPGRNFKIALTKEF